ncbi:pollen-specific leucine-rich repeat extensin-like protein 2 [Phalaenopsis equestris]|uniref:pollen-specific leucine-rich repeat extensin-like protein 2 n=1 Tax=Phalaenopsis equestris TaxID=78828 RepID=UPI0009E1A03C|nr:pollen-specific leucine-rich repeat extensin-like protein 2 [Phalaenopsis equestris]
MNSSVETVNAAAAAMASAESRVQPATVSRRRWSSYFKLYWCFGSHHHGRRISHAVLVPTPPPQQVTAPPPEITSHPPSLVRPFIAPPSSPVSFLQSGPPSATLSPAGGITLSALSADIYSPGGRPSIFAIGPYANETQLVSPPVFSTFTTEPSTAPFTPPPESVQFTTPSSPEVPFAKLLTSVYSNSKKNVSQELNSYHLISPSTLPSGTSSPFPDREFHSSRTGSFPKHMDRTDFHELVTRRASRNSHSLFNGQNTTLNPTMDTTSNGQGNEPALAHRVSFELTAEEVTRCLDRKPILSSEAALEFPVPVSKTSVGREQDEADGIHDDISFVGTSNDSPSSALLAVKEFKFSNSERVESDWWANEKKFGMENTTKNNWAFFPLIQPGMS